MSDKDLRISADLSVPKSIAARTVFIAGTKGSGKTYTAGVLAEEMLSAGVHVVILDPLGVSWGLRHDADGGPGGFPIVILGGEHADVPLLPTGGEAVAEFVVRSGQSCILDMSGFAANAEQDRFVTDLLHRLFRLKAADKAALHLIIDEADMFVPQQALSKTEIPLLGATKTIVTKGRSRGLSMTMITQRPQAIAKAAIEEADVVFCHRMQGVNAVKAMKAWTDLYATAEQAETFFDSLPTLADGECWVWSPNFLKAFERVQIRRKRTFNSSRTPDPGETVRKPKAAAKVDLDKLTAEMKATAEAAKANDPAALRKRLTDLERQLAARPAAEPKVIEKPVVTDKQVRDIEAVAATLEREGNRRLKAADDMAAGAKELAESGRELIQKAAEFAAALSRAAGGPAHSAKLGPAPCGMPGGTPRGIPYTGVPVLPRPRPQREAAADGTVTARQQRFLDAAATLTTLGADVTRETVCGWVGVHPRGGSVGEELKALEDAGLIVNDRGRIAVTDAGMAAAGNVDPGAAIDRAKSGLSPRQRRFFDLIAAAYPEATTREAIAAECGIHPRGGSLGEDLGRLVGRGLVEADRGRYRARDFLFAGRT